MSDTTDGLLAVMEVRRSERRARFSDDYCEAVLAGVNRGRTGIRMMRFSDSYYRLFVQKWSYDIYPGNGHIRGLRSAGGIPPRLDLPPEWTLGDLLAAARCLASYTK